LLVTAQVAPAFALVTNVTLRYRVMFGSEVALPMFDDGATGDGLADDRIYGATIPAAASSPGQMVRYYVTAADSLGNQSRTTVPGRSERRPAVFRHRRAKPGRHQRRCDLFVVRTRHGQRAYRTGTRCSVFYNGEFYDNVFVRDRGGFTSIGSQEVRFQPGLPVRDFQ